jgi:xanthine dehydrogenase accessory factor
MLEEFEQKLAEYKTKNLAYATAVVVHRQAPSSGKAGDKAVINSLGQVFGWVGGGCTKGIIVKEATEAIFDGSPRLVKISPESKSKTSNGVKEYKMTCHSGGTVEVFIEPVLPKTHLVVLGNSAIARALVKLGKAMNYRVSIVATGIKADNFQEADEVINKFDLSSIKYNKQTFIVVATQGEQDELALLEATKKDRNYLAFVASKKKRTSVYEYLKLEGISESILDKIKSPAGLDINAKSPEEVALSILGEIVQTYRQSNSETGKNNPIQSKEAISDEYYINPVCNIPIEKSTAKHIIDFKNEKVYFCCDGCKVKFEAEREKYLVMN